MKIIKLSDKKFKQLKKYVDNHCEFIIDSCVGSNDSYLLETLMERNEPMFDLQESLNEVKNNG